MEYSEILENMSKFSLAQKMEMCNHFSHEVMTVAGILPSDQLVETFLPWDIETFAIFSFMTQDGTPEITQNGAEIFSQIMNAIHLFAKPMIRECKDIGILRNYINVPLSQVQFNIQENAFTKYYRYSYFFNYENANVNMKDIFFSAFGSYYEDFRRFGVLLRTLVYTRHSFKVDDLFSRYSTVVNNLSISREEYVRQVSLYARSVDDYLYCVRPSYSFPFVRCDTTLKLPLPHLLSRSVTDSLLYRLTQDNVALRQLFGKEVLESYLFDLICDSVVFDEVLPEGEYGRTNNKTIDVMARKGQEYLFLDSKSFVPNIGLRIHEDQSIAQDTKRLIKGVCQMYTHLKREFPNEYNEFAYKETIVGDGCKWGIVVVLEDPCIYREEIYRGAANALGILESSAEYLWMVYHVKIYGLYDIEMNALASINIIELLKQQEREQRRFDFFLINESGGTISTSQKYDLFRKEVIDCLRKDLADYLLLFEP